MKVKSILLIEDNFNILENLIEYFEMEGYKIFSTNNGEKGIELARKFMPDLIICDTPKPGIDGHEVLRLLLDRVATSEIPFIFSTTNSETIDRSNAIKLGADDYIIKPFELDTMLHMAKACIKSGSKRQNYTL
jgi:CRP/FNR family transcriptional regulator, cyclic AMP receptor protein